MSWLHCSSLHALHIAVATGIAESCEASHIDTKKVTVFLWHACSEMKGIGKRTVADAVCRWKAGPTNIPLHTLIYSAGLGRPGRLLVQMSSKCSGDGAAVCWYLETANHACLSVIP